MLHSNDDDAWRILEQAAQTTGVTLPDDWKPRLFSKYVDVEGACAAVNKEEYKYCIRLEQERLNARLVAMLLVLLPRLEHLSLETSTISGESRDTFLLSMNQLGVIDLQLKSAALSFASPPWLSFFNLVSNLETLHLHGYKSLRNYIRLYPLPNLKDLRLTRCRLHKDELAEILSACTGLKAFYYEADWPSLRPCPWQGMKEERGWPERRDQYHFQPSDAVTHLLRHCDTLRLLHLDLRRRGVLGEGIKPLPSFQKFTALDHLFLHTSQLWMPWSIQPRDQAGLDIPKEERLNRILPRGIVSLHVANTYGKSQVQTKALRKLTFAVGRGKFPRLKKVRCDAKSEFPRDKIAIFVDVGVDFGYKKWPVESWCTNR
jgi:hypothetical protein